MKNAATETAARPVSYAEAPASVQAHIRKTVWNAHEWDIVAEAERDAYEINCDDLGRARSLVEFVQRGVYAPVVQLYTDNETGRRAVVEDLATRNYVGWYFAEALNDTEMTETKQVRDANALSGLTTKTEVVGHYRDMDYHLAMYEKLEELKDRAEDVASAIPWQEHHNHPEIIEAEENVSRVETWLENAWSHVIKAIGSYIDATESNGAYESAYQLFHDAHPWDEYLIEKWCGAWYYDEYTEEIFERAHVTPVEKVA